MSKYQENLYSEPKKKRFTTKEAAQKYANKMNRYARVYRYVLKSTNDSGYGKYFVVAERK